MRVLSFNSEDYVDVERGPTNHIARMPLRDCGLDVDLRDYTFNARAADGGLVVDEAGAVEAARRLRPSIVLYNQGGYGGNLSAAAFAASARPARRSFAPSTTTPSSRTA